MNRIVKEAMKTPKKSPAIPSTAEIASGIVAASSSDPDWTLSAAPESPTHDSSSSDSRRFSICAGRSWRKSRTDPTIGTRKKSATTRMRSAAPSTVAVAARPRDHPVFAITHRTGYSNTSAPKMPTKTTRKVSPIETNAAITPIAAATTRIVRMGISSCTRRVS